MIRPRTYTKVIDKGWDKIKKNLSQNKKAFVQIGITEDSGQYPDGPMVVEVALWNEFGTSTSPERSFFRSAIDQHEAQINQWREEVVSAVLSNQYGVKKALEILGFRIQVLIQNQIKSNVPPPNAASTMKAKQAGGTSPKGGMKEGFEGRTGTLIDTGTMLRSVTYKVVLE